MKSSSWKVRGAVAAAAASLLVLSACSTNANTPDGENVLTVGTDDADRLDLLVAAFEEANPGVTVNVVASGAQGYEEFMRTRITAGTAPDVIRVFPGAGGNAMTVGQLSKVGVLADLSDEAWTSELNTAQQSLFAGPEGEIVAVPLGATALAPVWNDAALEEIGATIPETYTELLELCPVARENGKVVFGLGQKDLFVTQLTPYAITASLLNGPDPEFTSRQYDGEATFADSPWVESFEMLLEMLDAGCFNDGVNGTSYDESMRLMGSGAALAQVTFADLSSQQEVAGEGVTFTMTAFPVDDGEPYMAIADSYGFAVNKDAKLPDLAKKFVAFIASAAGQNAFAEAFGGVPSLPNDTFEATSDVQQNVIDYIASGKTAIWPDQLWPTPEVQQVLFTVVQNMFNGAETPEGAAQKMDEAFQAGLAQ